MFGRDTVRLLEGHRGIIVGLITPGGEPYSTRAWAITVVSADDGLLRVLLDAADLGRVGSDLRGRPIAVTVADIETLHSMQVKGRVTDMEGELDSDRERAGEHCAGFFDVLVRTDGMDRGLLERLVPQRYLAITMTVDEAFDQTPGPSAGARVTAGGR